VYVKHALHYTEQHISGVGDFDTFLMNHILTYRDVAKGRGEAGGVAV